MEFDSIQKDLYKLPELFIHTGLQPVFVVLLRRSEVARAKVCYKKHRQSAILIGYSSHRAYVRSARQTDVHSVNLHNV